MTWGIGSYSTTPGSNTAINGINIAPGCPSSSVGPALRQLLADIANALAGNAGGSFVPVGAIFWFPVATAPTGYQALDFSAISRAANPNLFALIGTTYGAGDGSTTFNVPDWRGRTPVGYDAGNASGRLTASATGGISASTIGNTGGEQAHALIIAELAAHNHGINDPGHVHGPGSLSTINNVFTPDFGGPNQLATGSSVQATGVAITGNTASATNGLSMNNTGSGNGHNNVQPGIVQLPCIRLG